MSLHNQKDWTLFTEMLRTISKDISIIDDNQEIKTLIAKISKKAKKRTKYNNRIASKEHDKKVLQSVGIRAENDDVRILPNSTGAYKEVVRAKDCYVCNKQYYKVHSFYHRLCPECAELNYEKRQLRANFSNYTVLVTGGRVKIGYHTALRFLRDGANVIVTTRFPHNALLRYSQESDYAIWKDRLEIYGVDFKKILSLENFLYYLQTTKKSLDIIINNAAQTVRLPQVHYNELIEAEAILKEKLSTPLLQNVDDENVLQIGVNDEKESLPIVDESLYALQPTSSDLTTNEDENSWMKTLSEIDTIELLEVNLINNVAPFLINSKLKPLLMNSPNPKRFIINVTSVEGQFSYPNRRPHHPHTNMTKAALNMMTATSSPDFAKDNIFMNSVDVGWISSNNPGGKDARMQKDGFFHPLDCEDAASRIYDPIVQGVKGEATFGKLYKDYFVTAW